MNYVFVFPIVSGRSWSGPPSIRSKVPPPTTNCFRWSQTESPGARFSFHRHEKGMGHGIKTWLVLLFLMEGADVHVCFRCPFRSSPCKKWGLIHRHVHGLLPSVLSETSGWIPPMLDVSGYCFWECWVCRSPSATGHWPLIVRPLQPLQQGSGDIVVCNYARNLYLQYMETLEPHGI